MAIFKCIEKSGEGGGWFQVQFRVCVCMQSTFAHLERCAGSDIAIETGSQNLADLLLGVTKLSARRIRQNGFPLNLQLTHTLEVFYCFRKRLNGFL